VPSLGRELTFKKKTKWGGAFLEFFDKSECALLHLDCYPVYLQLNHVLGTKVVETLVSKCVNIFRGSLLSALFFSCLIITLDPDSSPAYSSDLIVKLYLSGAINEKSVSSLAGTLLEDEEPRMRKAALSLLWRLTMLNKANNAIFPPRFRPGTDSVEPPIQDNRRNKGRAAEREEPLGFGRVIQIVSAKLKDKHALVQLEASTIIKEMAQLSIAALQPHQRAFLLEQLLCDGQLLAFSFPHRSLILLSSLI